MAEHAEEMRASAAVEAGTAVVTVAGAVDISTVDDLRSALDQALAARPESLTVDLTGVTFIDSTGLAAVVKANRQLAVTVIVAAESYARVVFDATGLSTCIALITR